MDLKQLVRPEVLAMAGYHPGPSLEELCLQYGLPRIIELGTNENAWGSSPLAQKAIQKELERVERYPDPSAARLRAALAKQHGISPEMIVVANGADNLLGIIVSTFLRPGDEAIAADLTFPVYRKVVALAGARLTEAPLKNYTHDLSAMAAAVGPSTRLLFLCNPNNPTGTAVDPAELMGFIRALPEHVVCVLDEVYIQFAEQSLWPDSMAILREARPVISLGSFSKLYGLAGLRVGYAMAPPDLAFELAKVKEPFAANSLAQAGALAALADEDFRRLTVENNATEREFLARGLAGLNLAAAKSQTNFLFVDLGREAGPTCQALLRAGVLVRPMTVWGAPNCIRVTTGTREQNQMFLDALAKVLA